LIKKYGPYALLVGILVAIAAVVILDPTPKGSTPVATTLEAGAPARPCYAPPHYVPYRITARQARYGFGRNGLPSDAGMWMWVSPQTKEKWDSGWLPEHPQLGPFKTQPTTKPVCALTVSPGGSSRS